MRHKIAFQLSSYFAIALICFAVIIGIIFTALFNTHTMNIYKQDLEKRAAVIAEKLSPYLINQSADQGQEKKGSMNGAGYGAFIKNLNDVAMADVWVVDRNLNMLVTGQAAGKEYTYGDLPVNAEAVVSQVFAGKTAFSQSFSNLFEAPTLTVGTPILNENGEVIGVVLLHTSVEGIDSSTMQGIYLLLLSITVALGISVLLSAGLSIRFTRPLLALKNITLNLAQGDYSAKTGISRKDEIGVLASSIDTFSEQLKEAEQQSERFEKMRNDFVSNVSHELRTPITVIRGSLEALLDGVVTDEKRVREYLEQMLLESKFLQRMVGDLLDLSKLQNADFKIDMRDILLCEVLQDAARSARAFAKEKDVLIDLEVNSDSCTFKGDYDRIRQMFIIVLDNAVKFSKPGGKVEIILFNDEDLHVTIRDYGKGISPDEVAHIFDRFYKLDSEQNKSGTGLGLAIAKQIALRHGIEIKVRSEEGIGSVFEFKVQKSSYQA